MKVNTIVMTALGIIVVIHLGVTSVMQDAAISTARAVNNNRGRTVDLLELAPSSSDVRNRLNARVQAALHHIARVEARVYRLEGEAWRAARIDEALMSGDEVLKRNDENLFWRIQALYDAHAEPADDTQARAEPGEESP